jgi:hypothetical protein
MKHLFLILFFLVIILFVGCYHPTPAESFSDLQKIEGTWTSYEGTRFNEYWEKINDSLMKGIGYSLRGTDTVFSERLIIKRTGDSIYYGALVTENKDYVLFKMENANRHYWKFVNPVHDYPNIIEYEMHNDTLMEASTTNIRGNKKIVFKLRKLSP